MQTQVRKWGNSLALRIPSSFAADTQLEQGSLVDITIQNGNIIIAPITNAPSLEDLLSEMTPENRHSEVEIGEAMGLEAWK